MLRTRLTDPQNWFQVDSDGGMQLLDPVYAIPLDPDSPPRFITDEPALRGGLEWLERNGHQLHITNFYTVHGRGIDLSNHSTSLEDAIRGSRFLAYEWFGNSAEAEKDQIRIAQKVRNNPPTSFMYESFLERIHRALPTDGSTIGLPIDARSDQGTPTELAFLEADKSFGHLAGSYEKAGATIRLGAYAMGACRDWLILATLGIRLEQQLGADLQNGLNMATLMGASHRDTTRKLQRFRVAATPVEWAPQARPQNLQRITDAATRLASTGRVSAADRYLFETIV